MATVNRLAKGAGTRDDPINFAARRSHKRGKSYPIACAAATGERILRMAIRGCRKDGRPVRQKKNAAWRHNEPFGKDSAPYVRAMVTITASQRRCPARTIHCGSPRSRDPGTAYTEWTTTAKRAGGHTERTSAAHNPA